MERHMDTRPDDPFAVFVSWRPPHWPYEQYPAEHNLYNPDDMDVPGNVPDEMKAFAHQEIADYYGCCTGLDAEMERVLQALERLEVSDNTIVVYTSDHGDHLSSHGYGKPSSHWMPESMRASKATPYEESCHVPFVVRWPGAIKAGSRTDAFLARLILCQLCLARAVCLCRRVYRDETFQVSGVVTMHQQIRIQHPAEQIPFICRIWPMVGLIAMGGSGAGEG